MAQKGCGFVKTLSDKKIFVILVVLAIGIYGVIFAFMSHRETTKPPISVTAETLAEAYAQSEQGGKNKYNYASVSVRGTVLGKEKIDEEGQYIVGFAVKQKGNTSYVVAAIIPPNKSKWKQMLAPGKTVIVTGTCLGIIPVPGNPNIKAIAIDAEQVRYP